ncbi:MAG: TolC family protein [Vicinamibacterales bacterium]
MSRGVWLGVVALLTSPVLAAQPVTGPGSAPLTVEELLGSVNRALPLLEQARQEVTVAQGALVEAQGGFDLTLKADAMSLRGFYDNDRAKGVLEQPLAPLGMTAYGGYRVGRGSFAAYDTKAQTLSNGEVTAGLVLPLLRDRNIDPRRAGRSVAEAGVDIAERGLDKARLIYYREALGAYWEWVAAGQQWRIAQALLDLAVTRDQQLADAVALGQTAPVERTDNRRAILQRQSALASAQREVERQAIGVSLFLRDVAGTPVRPGSDRMPRLPRPTVGEGEPDEAEETRVALERRPELKAIRLERQQQEVELRLAENSLLPRMALFAESSRDFGTGPSSRVASVFETGIAFELPFQRRKATGKSLQARARLATLDQKLRWMEDEIRADVQDAISALRAARTVLDVVTEEVAVARELEALERDRFELGESTQFLVNLRELATADAALREAKALADYQKALVSVESATGRLVDRVPAP